MKYSKGFMKALSLPNNYSWSGFWDGMHHFTRPANNKRTGYYYIKCEPEDIEDGNIYDMAEYEVSK